MKIMLVLSRKPGEVIQVGDDIKIVVVRIGLNTVSLGIVAPRDINIVREELIPGNETQTAEQST
jgi:carbon storage regulator